MQTKREDEVIEDVETENEVGVDPSIYIYIYIFHVFRSFFKYIFHFVFGIFLCLQLRKCEFVFS